jgi:DNA (cytosine-5)-methyltransferase 1
MRFISMFSGIEAASVAFKPLGWEAVVFAEIEAFPSSVLSHHYPDITNVGDMTAHDWSQYRGLVDIVCGGPPCQAFSVAGLRESLNDARGNLSITYMRALHAIKPRNAIVENVTGWLSTTDNAFGCFLAGLVGADGPFIPVERKPVNGRSTRWWRWSEKEGCHAICWPNSGMVIGPKGRAAWTIKDGQYFGLAQRRERVLVVADFGTGADPAAVLFERIGMQGNSPPSRKAGQRVAGTIAGGARASGYSTDDIPLTAQPLLAKGNSSHANGGVGPAIAFMTRGSNVDTNGEIAGTIGTNADRASGGAPMVAQTVALRGREGGATAELGGEVATALRASSGGGDKPHVLAETVYSIMPQNSGKDYKARPVDVAQPLMAGGPVGGNQGGDYVLTSAVRRLTPRECERLQGFPDDYTRIPMRWYKTKRVTRTRPDDMWEADPNGGWWLMAADGPRYKALGNSWAVPKFRWLGERIMRFMPPRATHEPANDNQPMESSASTNARASHA